MYPFFIELHNEGRPISLNVQSIIAFNDGDKNNGWITVGIDKGQKVFTACDESYTDLKALIEGCGCLINKADPRLDTSHPLTMEDLKDMIGQPVWNSNTGEWGLIDKDPAWDDESVFGYYLRYHAGEVTRLDEQALLSRPLYRMKTAD